MSRTHDSYNKILLFHEENGKSLFNIVTLRFDAEPPPLDKLLDAISILAAMPSAHFTLHCIVFFIMVTFLNVLSALEKGEKMHGARFGGCGKVLSPNNPKLPVCQNLCGDTVVMMEIACFPGYYSFKSFNLEVTVFLCWRNSI